MEPLISKLSISMFRGIRALDLDHLSRINVLIGANNSGKTSILEAIRLMSQPYNIGTLMQVAFLRTPVTMRKTKSVEYFSSIFVKETETDGKSHYSLAFETVIDNISYKYEAGGDIGELTDSAGGSDKIFSLTIKVIQEDKKPVYISHNIKIALLRVSSLHQNHYFMAHTFILVFRIIGVVLNFCLILL